MADKIAQLSDTSLRSLCMLFTPEENKPKKKKQENKGGILFF
jgi:hypothetical protein